MSSTAATAAAEDEPVGDASPGVGSWKLARVAVAAVCSRSAALVSGPTIPSTVRPLLVWSFCTASSVSGPNTPSTLTAPSACCSRRTCLPSEPSLSTMLCSVVVGGPAAGVTGPLPSARLALGAALSATSAPSEIRLARALPGTNRSFFRAPARP